MSVKLSQLSFPTGITFSELLALLPPKYQNRRTMLTLKPPKNQHSRRRLFAFLFSISSQLLIPLTQRMVLV